MIKASVFLFLSITIIGIFSQNASNANKTIEDERIYAKFQKFMRNFGKNYTSIEQFEKKYEVFRDNYKNALSLRDPEGKDKNIGVTEFMDLSPEEFVGSYLSSGYKKEDIEEVNQKGIYGKGEMIVNNKEAVRRKNTTGGRFLEDNTDAVVAQEELPTHFDWRSYGAVSKVKNQHSCGGCWAFSIIAAVEGQYYLKYGKLKTFSEQQLIDCVGGVNSCVGGTIQNGLNYLIKHKVERSTNYPYRSNKRYCMHQPVLGAAKLKNWYAAGTDNEDYIAELLYKTGPLSIIINASMLQYYKGGIFNPSYCSTTVNHGVAIVGFGEQNGVKYWIVKNTWGTTWGEGGFFRIARGRNLCGLTTQVIAVSIK